MAIVLVTGMSATGKSTVLADLARRGYDVVDTDDPGWSIDATDADGIPDRRWNTERIGELIRSHDDADLLFVSGCVSNQADFYDDFDAVVLLSCPESVLLQRLAARDNNPFGKSDRDRKRILEDLSFVEPLLRRRATVEIGTRAPIGHVADAIIDIGRRSRPLTTDGDLAARPE